MRQIVLIAAVVASATSAQPALGALSAATNHDVQCFMLYAAGIAMAEDDKARTSASMGTMYFFGKLKAEAPEVDLEQAIRVAAEKIAHDPNAKEIGKACDVEVQKQSAELQDLGQRLQRTVPQSSPSSS